jgi:predicted O-methyltransferase YrrM
MRKTPDRRLPPASIARIEALLAESGLRAAAEPGAGELARALAASKPGGVFLQVGDGSPLLSAWLLDGMDITSRLITVVGAAELTGVAKRTIGDDIRVAVHEQDVLAFFEDIRAHQFHMIVFEGWPPESAVIGGAVGLLAPGGLLLVLCADRSAPDEGALALLGEDARVRIVEVSGAARAVLAVRTPVTPSPLRRLGRRGRRGEVSSAVR